MVSRTQIRRWAAKQLRRTHLPLLAAQVDPGARVRLWDAHWNLRADTDRGDHVDLGAVEGDMSVVFEPATTIRWSGKRA